MPVWGFLLSLLVASMWAISPILMKKGMKRAGPNEVNPIRSFSYLLTMTIAFVVLGDGTYPTLTPLLLLGLIVNVSTSAVMGDQLYIFSINKIGASLAVSISCGYPLIATFFSILLLGEQITTLVWIGTVCIICGLIVIKLASSKKRSNALELSNRDRHAATETFKGIVFAVGAAVCWGANMPFMKMLMVQGNWTAVELYFLRSVIFICVVWGLRLFLFKKFRRAVMPLKKVPLKSWLAFLASGSVAMAIAGILYGYCISMMPVSVVTPITASSPFVTVLIARLFYREKLSRLQNVGIVLVIAGSIAVSL